MLSGYDLQGAICPKRPPCHHSIRIRSSAGECVRRGTNTQPSSCRVQSTRRLRPERQYDTSASTETKNVRKRPRMRTATTEMMLTTSQTIELGFRGGCRHCKRCRLVSRNALGAHDGRTGGTYHETGHAAPPHALSAVALESDVGVAENVVDELIHRRLFEFGRLARLGCEFAGSLDLLGEEVRDVCRSYVNDARRGQTILCS